MIYKKGKLNENRMDEFNVIKNTDKDRFIADPFLFENNKNNYLFVEDFSFKQNKGAISCYELKNNDSVFLVKVLEDIIILHQAEKKIMKILTSRKNYLREIFSVNRCEIVIASRIPRKR